MKRWINRGAVRLLLLVAAALTIVLAAPAALRGQAVIDRTVQVSLDPIGTGELGGVALLAPAADGGTAVQVLVTGAPEGTLAVIHPGSCDPIDPVLVALLGDAGTGPSLQVTVPVSFEVLADGSHSVALHEGTDFSTALACGAIPAAVPGPSPGSSLPKPSPPPDPTSAPGPTPDPECEGVPAWLEATEARLDRIVDLQAEADAFITEGDPDGYIASVGRLPGEVRALLAEQRSDPVPPVAQDANTTAIETFGHFIEAGETLYKHITVSATLGYYERFLEAIKAANEGMSSVRSKLGDLSGRCI
jgi:hypothetical protein